MTGILLSIMVISISAFLSARKTIKTISNRRATHSKNQNSAIEQLPTLNTPSHLPLTNISDEPPTSQPYAPAKTTSITHVLSIYQKIALQKGYYASIIDILNHPNGTNFILWLDTTDISCWQEQFDLRPISNLPDPAASLTLYDQNLHSALADIFNTDLTRIVLFTMHYSITNLTIKSTKPTAKNTAGNSTQQIQTKELTYIHHRAATRQPKPDQQNPKLRIIPPPQTKNNPELPERETRGTT